MISLLAPGRERELHSPDSPPFRGEIPPRAFLVISSFPSELLLVRRARTSEANIVLSYKAVAPWLPGAR